MIIETFEQYSKAWWEGRRGLPTASSFSKIVSSTGKKSASWKEYAFKKAAEIETGKVEKTYKSKDMDRGTELEPEARENYEFITDIKMEQVGMVFRDEKKLWACSPDGLNLDVKKGLEIKCPIASTHKKYCYENRVPTEYKPQVYGSLWICDEIETWDFMSYHPDMKPFIITVTRDDEDYKNYIKALSKYLPEVVDFITAIK